MRLLSFAHGDTVSWGIHTGEGIVDLGARYGGSLQETLSRGALDDCLNRAANLDTDHDPETIRYLSPILRPEKILCIGVNYANRNEEYKDGSAPPAYPSVFMRTPDSLTGHLSPLLRPPESHQLDYEGEIVVVVGKQGRRITEARALDHVAGLSIMNEGTLRDWVRHAKFNVTQGKNFVQSGAIGPWMVSADEFSPERYGNLHVTTTVNGETRQDDSTASMMFPIPYLISYLSTFLILKPGDIIATGTPNGAGARFDPPRYLKPGDEVAVEVEAVGRLINTVEDEQAGQPHQ